MEKFLRRWFRYKEIGWEPIGEKFTRYAIVKTRWFALYLHQLNAPNWHEQCHDHPWSFITLLLWRGYLEETAHTIVRRWPGQVLYRSAKFAHNIITPYGTSWSLVLVGPKTREWGFRPCGENNG